ncbi:MAG: S49 family peptidase [bacterium]
MGVLIDLIRNLFRLLANVLAAAGPSPEYVVVDLAGSYPERRVPRRRFSPQRVIALEGQPEESLEELRATLDRLVRAPGVRGVIMRVGEIGGGTATVQRLREALLAVRRAGRRVIVYLTTVSLPQYYLATAADEIVLPESASVAITGPRTEVTFFRAALDRLGVAPEFDSIAEYKTAADPFRRAAMSPTHREMVDALLDSTLGQMVEDVAAARRVSPDAVREAIDRAPFTAAEALAAGLVDAILYEDELPARLGQEGHPARVAPWVQARRRVPLPYEWRSAQDIIAVVTLRGAIVPGESRDIPAPIPLLGRHLAGAATVGRAFRAVERMRRVKAVVFYVDSRGGSALASDLIWREVERVKRRRPVVAFMGDVAGSGGYYVACGAHRVIASPSTITGSIGVVTGKFVLTDLYERYGLHREVLARGTTATMFSGFTRLNETEWERIRAEMADVYTRFKRRVTDGRGRPEAEIEAIARGRVWTGRQALERGLVDELGDFALAVRRARELAGIPEGRAMTVATVRPPRVASSPSWASAVEETVTGLRQVRALADERTLLLM